MPELSQPPETAGRYQLLVPIGAGGMATVYLARAPVAGDVHRDVAVKVLKTNWDAAPEAGQDLVEEAKLAASVRHANVVPVIEVVREDGKLCLVMEYVEGETLAGLISSAKRSRRRVPSPICARILIDALRGLHAAHELRDGNGVSQNLVHRDFSPQNILVGMDGISRLTDFGIAKAVSRLGATTQNVLKGKIGYMSPEQVRGSANLDRRSDVWAAGVVTWEVMAGRRLFREQDDVATLLHIVSGAPIPQLIDVVPDVSRALSDVVNAALQRDANQRIASAAAFEEALSTVFKANGGIADSDAVGRYVNNDAGEKLRERREAARRVVELRSRLQHVSDQAMQVADEHTVTTPSGVDALPLPPPSAPSTRRSSSRYLWVAAMLAVGVGAAVLVFTSSGLEATTRAERVVLSRSAGSKPAPVKELRVIADRLIRSVRVGDEKTVEVPEPRRSVRIKFAESGQTRTVRVMAVDGREQVVPLAPGSDTLELEFPPRPTSRKASPSPARSPKTKPPPFATTPY